MRRTAVVVVAVFAVSTALLAGLCQPAAAAVAEEPERVTYAPPVDAPIVDPFRAPATKFGPGNRGLEYATEPGTVIRASAGGEVVFSGRVGAGLHVVVLHSDGLRTTYAFLAETTVRRGDRVAAGEVVGQSGDRFHFGARLGEAYVDPLVLFGQRPPDDGPHVRLVADPHENRPLTEVQERKRLLDELAKIPRAVVALVEMGVDHAIDSAEGKVMFLIVLASDAVSVVVPAPARVAMLAYAMTMEQEGCTPADDPVPPPRQRRIAFLVGGLGSSTGRAGVLDVDTRSLGYAPEDVHQFNYRGDGRPYGPVDTQVDIDASARELARQVITLQNAEPGVPIDVIAHSEGGLVARAALTGPAVTQLHVATFVSLATPHQGADLASAAVAIDGSSSGSAVLWGAGKLNLGGIDAQSTSVQQMSTVSPFIRHLPETGWPPETNVVSIAGRGDPIVPSSRSRLDPSDAANVVVTAHGEATLFDHERLLNSPEATREIGLAIAGKRPTCRSLLDIGLDATYAVGIADVEDQIGAAAGIAGMYVDTKVKGAGMARLGK